MTTARLPHACPGLVAWIEDDNIPVEYISKFREYAIRISDNELAIMSYCPRCGTRLPDSLRDEWFERLWSAGLDGPEDVRIPGAMRTDEWWITEDL